MVRRIGRAVRGSGVTLLVGAFTVVPLAYALQQPEKLGTPPKAPVSAPARKPPRPVPPPVTSLDVTVTDPTGKPVEGAFVMALPTQGAYRPYGGVAPEKVHSTLTGRDVTATGVRS